MELIKWCNENNGFMEAILSLSGLFISTTAIVVSICTARLPYKKKLALGSSLTLGASVIPGKSAITQVLGMAASATNIGNRVINLKYLGYAFFKDGKWKTLYPYTREFNCKAKLEPSENGETQFYVDELRSLFWNENKKEKVYVFAMDSEGSVYKKKIGTVEKLLTSLCD